jgi:hypothetical protein
MLVGIVVVGAVVFGALWVGSSLLGNGVEAMDTTSTSTSSTAVTVAPSSTATAAQPSTTAPPAETTTPTITPRPPEEIVVQVLNAVGTTGLASEASNIVRAAGYQTIAPDDYEPTLEQSAILFRDGFGPEAFELAALFPDAEVGMSQTVPDGVDLMVLLGASYEGG